jgi:phenylpropionate dioxygenase-like ring-hydroxylating dioxygenase large terminal subunit
MNLIILNYCFGKSFNLFNKIKINIFKNLKKIKNISFFRNKDKIEIQKRKNNKEKENKDETEIINYNLNWYVIDEATNILKNKIYSKIIWNKKYLFWKDNDNKYHAIANTCNHRGASLSTGKLINNNIICPYHGLEFDKNGLLLKVPQNSNMKGKIQKCFNQESYNIFEKNGWIYLNIIGNTIYNNSIASISSISRIQNNLIYEEEESIKKNIQCIYTNIGINAYSRIVSENILDILHISFVHSFGNKDQPLPSNDPEYKMINDCPYHYIIRYNYKSGNNSIINKIYKIKDIIIENEFILPHTIISRVKFDKFIKTIITFALPINRTHTTLFIKTYRNYFYLKDTNIFSKMYNSLGDSIMRYLLMVTLNEDKEILENIEPNSINGKFNLKYDKFSYLYRNLYIKLIDNNTKIE